MRLLNDYLREAYGCKVYKLSLQAKVTCPNRDGTVGTGGCIFCSKGGSGEFAADADKPIGEQIDDAKQRVSAKVKGAAKYIAYFQSYTNTYGDTAYIEKVSNGQSILIVPEKMEGKAQEAAALVGKICTVNPGTYHSISGLEFDTVPAYNTLKPFHPKGAGWVGYILHIDGKRIYIAGDTDMTKDNKDVKCDIALVPIGGTYTMDAKKAAELVNSIRPSVAIPTHYGSIVGKESEAEVFADNVTDPIKVEIKKQY